MLVSRKRMRSSILLLFVSSVPMAACGTAVYDHRIEVTIQDPSGRLGPPPIAVSVFNKTMGSSEEWAQRWMGNTAPGAPYVGNVDATGTKMAFDSSPPSRVDAGIALPSYEKEGFLVLDVAPVEGPEQSTVLTFVPYGVSSKSAASIIPLPARFRSESSSKGWLIHLTIDVPPPTTSP